jgi:hypothetical protein
VAKSYDEGGFPRPKMRRKMIRTLPGFLDLAGRLRCLARCISWARSLAASTS